MTNTTCTSSSLLAPPQPGFVASILGQLMVCTCTPTYDARQMKAEAQESNSFEFEHIPGAETGSSSSSSYASHPFASAPILVGRYRKNEDSVEKTQKKKSSIFRIKPGRFMEGMDDLRVTHYPLSPVPSCDMTTTSTSSSSSSLVEESDDGTQASDVAVRGVAVKLYENEPEAGIFSRGNSIISCGDDDEDVNIIEKDDIHCEQRMQWSSANDNSVQKPHDQEGREVVLSLIDTDLVSLVGRAA